METLLQMLTVFGVGAICSAVIQFWLNNKSNINQRKFEEKKEAYIGLLEAYRTVAILNTEVAAKQFAYWQIRCELVGNKRILNSIIELQRSEANTSDRDKAIENLKNEFKKDLKID